MQEGKIDRLISNYNQIAIDEIEQKKNLQDRYNEAISIEKLHKWRAEKVNSISSEVKYLLDGINSRLNDSIKKTVSVKYPLRYSVLSSDRTLGELMRTNAFQFINLAKDKNLIVNEIDLAIQTEQIDYANNLIEIIELNKPNEIELSRASKEDREFYQTVENRKAKFEDQHKLSELKALVSELKIERTELEYLLKTIENEDPFIITLRQAKKLSQSEIEKLDLKYINKAMSYFSAIK